MSCKGILTQKGQSLQITAICSVALTQLTVTALTIDQNGQTNQLSRTLQLIGDGTQELFRIPLTDEVLQSVIINPVSSGIRRGQLFVRMEINSTNNDQGTLLHTLAANYTESFSPLYYPSSGLHSSFEGQGNILTTQIANPAANTNFTTVVPDRQIWKLKQLSFKIENNEAIATIFPRIETTTAGNVIRQKDAPTIPGGGTSRMIFFMERSFEEFATAENQICLPGEIFLNPLDTLQSSIQAAGTLFNISDIFLTTEVWLQP